MKRLLLVLGFSVLACTVQGQLPASTPEPVVAATITPAKTLIPVSTCLTVTASNALHVRAAPSAHSPALDWLLRGQRIQGLRLEGDWWQVEMNDTIGYVNADFVRVCDVQKRYNAKRY